METLAKPVPIDLGDGRERALLYSGPAVCAIERASGDRSIFSLIIREAGVNHMSVMIWGGLLWQTTKDPETGKDEPPPSLEQVQELVFARFTQRGRTGLFDAVYGALTECGILTRQAGKNGDGAAPLADPTVRAPESPPVSGLTTT